MPKSIESFRLGHSMISNKAPKGLSLKDIDKVDRKVSLESFGLFDSSSPDFNKFYPDMDPKEMVPQDEDFAYPLFRALSKVIVNKYGPIDFGRDGVLEDSMQKLVGQAVFTNHEAIVGNEVGVVQEAAFEGAKKYDGFEIPGGINVKLKLDGKANPKLIRGIMMDPPSVHSVSVTVQFMWEKSHLAMDDNEFWEMMGTYDKEGELIRRVVTQVFSYEEISLVSHGADPYAQRISDGKIANPGYADNKYSFSEEDFRAMGHNMDWKTSNTAELNLSAKSTIPSQNNNKSNNNEKAMNKEQLSFLRLTLGMDENATAEQVLAKLQESLPGLVSLKDQEAQVTQLTADLDTANAELTSLKEKYPEGTIILTEEDAAKLEAYPEAKKVSDAAMSATRAEALKLYHLSCGGAEKADNGITKLIAEAGFETLTSLQKQYRAQVEKDFTASCNDCNSTNVSRLSSADRETGIANSENQDGKEDTGSQEQKSLSIAETMEKLTAERGAKLASHSN